jgi:hypothetical protein
MNHYCDQWITDWCTSNGWTDWFREQSSYWAFPPNAVMPVPIPSSVLQAIKAENGLSFEERTWGLMAVMSLLLGLLGTCLLVSPMPLVTAFIFGAIVVAKMDTEESLGFPEELCR